ncbi:MAG: hypothetical protein KIS92_18865 [Planctomycetota bacterium]|nr:hypothetical protein [Planctomycetota bacterium]
MHLIGSSTLRIGAWIDDLRISVREAIKRSGGIGCEVIGLDGLGKEIHPRALTTSGRRELLHLIRSSGTLPAALRADVAGRRLTDPKSLDSNLTVLREAFELAKDLGIRQVVVPIGFVPPAPPPEASAEAAPAGASPVMSTRIWGSEASVRSTGFFQPAAGTPPKGMASVSPAAMGRPASDSENARTRATLAEGVRALVAFGSQLGIRPAVPGGSEPPRDLTAFLNEVDPSGMIDLDFVAGAYVSKGHAALETLTLLGNRVGLATLADFYRGGSETAFGAGDVPFGELLVFCSALPRAEGLPLLASCTRECDRAQALGEAVQKLKKMRQRPLV